MKRSGCRCRRVTLDQQKHRCKDKRLTNEERRLIKKTSSHRADHRAPESRPAHGLLPFEGLRGGCAPAVLRAADCNTRWLLRMIGKKY
jgi:hypothetical protein